MTQATEAPRTTLPARDPRPPRPPRPRQLSVIRLGDIVAVIGALVAALCTTALLFTQIGLFSGIVGFIVVTWLLFIAFYAVLVAMDEDRPTMRDRVAAVVVQSLGALVIIALGFVIGYTFYMGWDALIHLNFYTQDLKTTGSLDPLTKGGVVHAIAGTLIEVGIAMAISVPFGLLAAVFMNEVPGKLAQFVRTVVNAMTALPDVLAGLFIYATLVIFLSGGIHVGPWLVGQGFFGAAAACALAVTVVPIVCRAADVVLRLMPAGLTEASYALGSTQWRTVWYVTLPTTRSGLATAAVLGTARAVGETAPVLLTAGAAQFLNLNPLHLPMMSLPLLAFLKVLQSPEPNDITRGFGAASVLLILVFILFIIARAVGGRGPGQLTRRQAERRVAASQRDLNRFARQAGVTPMGTSTPPAPDTKRNMR